MTTQPMSQLVENVLNELDEKRYLTNLTHSLAAVAQVPDGRQLVAFIGEGTEHSNLEALTNWVSRNKHNIRGLRRAGIDPLDFLYVELIRALPNP